MQRRYHNIALINSRLQHGVPQCVQFISHIIMLYIMMWHNIRDISGIVTKVGKLSPNSEKAYKSLSLPFNSIRYEIHPAVNYSTEKIITCVLNCQGCCSPWTFAGITTYPRLCRPHTRFHLWGKLRGCLLTDLLWISSAGPWVHGI